MFLVALFAACPPSSHAQQSGGPAQGAARPFEIVDNSFLVEEAYNQEPGVLQNIFGVTRGDGGQWAASVTQEWPAPGVRHQLSYTVVFDNVRGAGGLGNVALNYRFQLRSGENGGLALSPRASLLVTSARDEGPDAGRIGLELNLPASRQFGDVYVHGNAGVRIYPAVGSSLSQLDSQAPAADVSLVSPFLAGSAILRVRPMLNLMLESVLLFSDKVVAPATTARDTSVIVSPGLRFGWNLGDQQVVLGMAVPFQHTTGDTGTGTGVFGYASWELPFRH